MKCIDPTTMSAAERLAELADILAVGVQRFFARECKAPPHPRNREEQLDATGERTAPCGPAMESAP